MFNLYPKIPLNQPFLIFIVNILPQHTNTPLVLNIIFQNSIWVFNPIVTKPHVLFISMSGYISSLNYPSNISIVISFIKQKQ